MWKGGEVLRRAHNRHIYIYRTPSICMIQRLETKVCDSNPAVEVMLYDPKR